MRLETYSVDFVEHTGDSIYHPDVFIRPHEIQAGSEWAAVYAIAMDFQAIAGDVFECNGNTYKVTVERV